MQANISAWKPHVPKFNLLQLRSCHLRRLFSDVMERYQTHVWGFDAKSAANWTCTYARAPPLWRVALEAQPEQLGVQAVAQQRVGGRQTQSPPHQMPALVALIHARVMPLLSTNPSEWLQQHHVLCGCDRSSSVRKVSNRGRSQACRAATDLDACGMESRVGASLKREA